MTIIAEPSGAGRFKLPRQKYMLFAAIALMYAYVLWTTEGFLINSKDPHWAHIEPFKWMLLPHGLVAACALFLGPLQFSDRLRTRYAKVHRVVGWIYVVGALTGAPLGAYIQYYNERLGTTRGFTIAATADAVVWMFCTLMALRLILQGRVQQHRQWMTRSFACSLIFLEVRAIMAGFRLPDSAIETVVWSCVVAAVPLADLVLQWQDRPRAKAVRAG